VFAFSWLAIILGATSLPEGVVWKALYGVSILCGIGFTMSLFIGSLALSPSSMGQMTDQRIAIIAGSLLSALFGYMLLKSALAHPRGQR
jgi:Na+:H+ antiporter, NhaA family